MAPDDDAADLRARVQELEQTLADHQATIEQLRDRGVGRRALLAGGAGLVGGAALTGQASAQSAAGQVGTSSEPVDVAAATVSAESVDAGSVNTDGLVANQSVRLARSTETISSGVINYSAPSIEVLGEGGSSDDLDQITGGRGYGEIAILQPGTANITVRSNQSSSDGRILLDGGTNKTLNNPADRLTLHLDTSLSPDTWCQISYSNF